MKKIKLTESQVKMLQGLKGNKIKISESQYNTIVKEIESTNGINYQSEEHIESKNPVVIRVPKNKIRRGEFMLVLLEFTNEPDFKSITPYRSLGEFNSVEEACNFAKERGLTEEETDKVFLGYLQNGELLGYPCEVAQGKRTSIVDILKKEFNIDTEVIDQKYLRLKMNNESYELKSENLNLAYKPQTIKQNIATTKSFNESETINEGLGNLVKGTIFEAKLPVFVGSYPKVKFSHYVTIKARIINESYGADKGQHTFTFEVLESDSYDYMVGEKYRKKGRNLYPNLISVEQGEDYEAMAKDKADRAKTQSAKSKRNNSGYGYDKDSENERNFRFNEEVVNESLTYSLLEFSGHIIDILKGILSNSSQEGLSPFFKNLGMSKGELYQLMGDIGLISIIGSRIYIKKDNLKDKIKTLYSKIKALGDPKQVPSTPETPIAKPENEFRKKPLEEDDEVINTKPIYFSSTHYRLPNQEELIDIDRHNLTSKEIINGISYSIIGKGIKSEKNINLIKQAIKLLIKQFPDKREYKEAFVTFTKANPKKEKELDEMTSAGGSSGSFVGPLGSSSIIKREMSPSNQIGETEELDETTTAGGASGSYETTKVWAKSPKDMKFGAKPVFKTGKIIKEPMKESDNKKDVAIPGGEFVEFNKCVDYNNMDRSDDCSQGAVDNVVKTKKTKNSVVSKK